jgi:hypothetical protein
LPPYLGLTYNILRRENYTNVRRRNGKKFVNEQRDKEDVGGNIRLVLGGTYRVKKKVKLSP